MGGNNQSLPLTSVPTLESYYTGFLLPNEASFFKTLTQRKTFDIQSKVDKIVDLVGAPPVPLGQPPVVSNQGNEDTCASHAVGKAIVDIIDGFNMDMHQPKLTEKLIKTVQPSRRPTFIREFCNKPIEVEIWSSGLRHKSRFVTIFIFVQSEINVDKPDWSGPKMTSKELKNKNTRVVAVWETKPCPHAVYVKEITHYQRKQGFTLDCVNSLGTQETNPQIPNCDISRLHYISLYMDTILLVTSSGPSAEYQGRSLGIYKEAGKHNNCPYYKQMDTVRTDGKENVIYRRKEGGWTIGTGLDGGYALKNASMTESVPLTGWTCAIDGKGRDDPHLRISPDQPPACGEITITASTDAAARQPECVGVYSPTKMFSAGRQVFKHQTQERCLYIRPLAFNFTGWKVKLTDGAEEARLVQGSYEIDPSRTWEWSRGPVFDCYKMF